MASWPERWERDDAAGRAVAEGPEVLGQISLRRLELRHSTMNPASCRVADRAGYALEGVKRHGALHGDGWHDMHLHARLAGDPPRLLGGQ